jgi:CRP-like cAMP-binding protein
MSDRPPPRGKLTAPGERTMKDGAWAWVNKSALEKIRNQIEDAQSALAVYYALAEIASDEQSGDFRASMDRIAAKCCFSRRTVAKRLNDLEFNGLVEIQRSETTENFKMPSAYLMLRCER